MTNLIERLKPDVVLNGRYTIRRRIGIGGFAIVYEAHDAQIDRLVAIKVLNLQDMEHNERKREEFFTRFEREAKLAARIRHPNVTEIYDYGLGDQSASPFIVMELLEGHDLEEHLERFGPMSPSHFIPLFLGCLDALGYSHREGIVHKDLKPSNLFLRHPGDRRESLCLVDFGVAHIQAEFARRLTQTGNLYATPSYIAPEYVQHQLVTPALDIYQMGLILIEAITGKVVVDSPDFMVCMFQHVQGKLRVPQALLESELGPLLRKALDLDHTKRFQDGFEFSDALRKIDPDNIPRLNSHTPLSPLNAKAFEQWVVDVTIEDLTARFGASMPQPDYELEEIDQTQDAAPLRRTLETPVEHTQELPAHLAISTQPATLKTEEFLSPGALGQTQPSAIPPQLAPPNPSVEAPSQQPHTSPRQLKGIVLLLGCLIIICLAIVVKLTQRPDELAPTDKALVTSPQPTPPIPPKDDPTPQPPQPKPRELTVNTAPTGAKVYYKDEYIGLSPQRLNIDDAEAKIVLELEGFKRLTTSGAATDQEQLTLKLEPVEVKAKPDKRKPAPEKSQPSSTPKKVEEPPKPPEPQDPPVVVKEDQPEPKADPKPTFVLPK